MAANQTTNYQLNQWEPTDAVLRTDFNQDNAKIDTELGTADAKLELLNRVISDLTYYTGQLALQDLLRRQTYLPQRALLCEAFLFPENLSLTGSAVVQNGVLTLPGANQTGTMTTQKLALSDDNWTTAKLWLRCTKGDSNLTTPYLNGQEMIRTGTAIVRSATGISCAEREFTWQGQGTYSAQLKLELASASASMSVYDYFIAFW